MRIKSLAAHTIVVSLSASDHDCAASITGFLLSRNRLNVAISRARTKAIIVVSPTAVGVVPTDYDALLARSTFRELLGQADTVDAIKSVAYVGTPDVALAARGLPRRV